MGGFVVYHRVVCGARARASLGETHAQTTGAGDCFSGRMRRCFAAAGGFAAHARTAKLLKIDGLFLWRRVLFSRLPFALWLADVVANLGYSAVKKR